jgi:hypothetical protein
MCRDIHVVFIYDVQYNLGKRLNKFILQCVGCMNDVSEKIPRYRLGPSEYNTIPTFASSVTPEIFQSR